jgi:ferredoxin-type protein NapH
MRKILKIDEVERKIRVSRDIRYWILGLSLILSAIFGLAAFEIISPIGILHRSIIFGFGIGITIVFAIFLFDLFLVKNGFCGHICPLGGFYSLISRFSIFRVRYNKESCTNCMNCIHICPEREVLTLVGKSSGFVTKGECTNCGRCIEVCNDNALKFDIRYFKKGAENEKID